ncbi:MAG: class I SAM-dependent methyltransferase [Gammaproteobacteria bacterium]|nr:class I SAM-dependent methyltransferase [Gammaproteobacteria bacterium]
MSREKPYSSIVAHYEDCLSRFGDTHLGVDWQNADDAYKRYQIMLDIIKPEASKITLLDFGCGTAGLLDYINEKKILYIDYSGLEISTEFFNVSKKKYPNNTFFNMDILDKDALLPCFDYIIMNGVFTEKIDLSHNIMFSYFCSMIETIYPHCRKGIAFNLRSKQVMAEDQDLFHLSLDELAWFLVEKFGRNFIIRNDYGLEEYAVYICKEP